ncbi:MAG: OmpH family outer membrane protein [Verrucomicrobiales bacterium]|jgi:Skp family chaperone for outer membrane proteins|nr:OmpH family outer membrane protein [Verrucomicrobiales bacterium]
MNKIITAVLCGASLLTLSFSAQAQTKIATIDMEVLSKDYYKVQEANQLNQNRTDQFRREAEARQSDYNKLVQQIQDISGRLKDSTLSESAKKDLEKKGNELVEQARIEENKFKEYQNASLRLLQDEAGRSQKQIFDKIKDAIATYSKGKFSLVLNKSASIVVLYDEGLTDITADVLRLLNAEKPSTAK